MESELGNCGHEMSRGRYLQTFSQIKEECYNQSICQLIDTEETSSIRKSAIRNQFVN